ncbi:DsbE family thiol:disulfide interchange protein [Cereibacter azotoformans]|uniref:DsbE family thiol:disulfide interchange protein n=1 Tax=Cereibacter azotoformans TaxID=43057 RepID=UPI000C6E07CA|nr:DsbE family thiol:disulfide interchange protein [Cereibacter azotoformans]
MAKALMLVPPLLFAGLAATFFLGMQRENPDELPSALAGKPAPAVQLTGMTGAVPFTDATLREPGVKLVNYWASWCAPCRVEAPTLEKLAAEGVAIHGVNYKDKPENAQAFLAELGNPYATMGADPNGRMALDWGVYGVPETYVIDGEGRIILRFPGPVTERTLQETIRPAMEKAAAPTN